MSNAIGKGASGTVYRSKLHGKDVAAKVCLQCNESEVELASINNQMYDLYVLCS